MPRQYDWIRRLLNGADIIDDCITLGQCSEGTGEALVSVERWNLVRARIEEVHT